MEVISTSSAPAEQRGLSRFNLRLARILEHATTIFCEKGYASASMRDLSRSCGMSLAGLYYYFESKEKLLYLIEKELFEQVMVQLSEKLEGSADPEKRVRVFINNHVEFFLSRPKAMKVLTHEDDVLGGQFGQEITEIKRRYYHCCMSLINDLKRSQHQQFNSRSAAMSLFGMINWLHTWYNPKIDGSPITLATQIGDIFLRGVCTATAPTQPE